jgi:hypothetical protein
MVSNVCFLLSLELCEMARMFSLPYRSYKKLNLRRNPVAGTPSASPFRMSFSVMRTLHGLVTFSSCLSLAINESWVVHAEAIDKRQFRLPDLLPISTPPPRPSFPASHRL